jgi:hypothetical protein
MLGHDPVITHNAQAAVPGGFARAEDGAGSEMRIITRHGGLTA